MVYLDHNATTPLDARVRAAMVAVLGDPERQGNPSSVHRPGQRARALVEEARRRVADSVGAEALEVTFTSGGTEADNLAVMGTAATLRREGRPSAVLCSGLEHPAVLEAGRRLEANGHGLVFVRPDERGRIGPDAVRGRLRERPDVGLVSLAAANHELGNVYDVLGLVAAIREERPDVLVHSDAVQAFGKVPVDFRAWDLDLMSISAHKIHGPKGIGALVHRKHLVPTPIVVGGHQERGLRPGTENVLGIHGFGVAAELARAELGARAEHCGRLRARILEGLGRLEGARVLGDVDANVGNTVLVALEGCDGELLMMNLDLAGVAVSTGAACTAGTLEPSPVVLALGLDPTRARSTLRVSVGKDNTDEDVDALLNELPSLVSRVRGSLAAGVQGGDR